MAKPRASIVIPTYNRVELTRRVLASIFKQKFPFEVLLVDDGSEDGTWKLKDEFPVRYFRLNRPGWTNPAKANNVGIRYATASVLILNSGETEHAGTDTIQKLTEAVEADRKAFVFATVYNYILGRGPTAAMCGKTNQRPLSFLGALDMAPVKDMRGFDEDYIYYGDDDTDFADRLTKHYGLVPTYRDDIEGYHLDHPRTMGFHGESRQLYRQKEQQQRAGTLTQVRNDPEKWGLPDLPEGTVPA